MKTQKVMLTVQELVIEKIDKLVDGRKDAFFSRSVAMREAFSDYVKKHEVEIAWDAEEKELQWEAEKARLGQLRFEASSAGKAVAAAKAMREATKAAADAAKVMREATSPVAVAAAAAGPTIQTVSTSVPASKEEGKRKVCQYCEAGYCEEEGGKGECGDNSEMMCLCLRCYPERAGMQSNWSNSAKHIERLKEALAERRAAVATL